MPHQTLRVALGLALGLFVANPASAFLLVSPTSLDGTLDADGDNREFEFTILSDSIVTIETVSCAGGVLAGSGAIQPAGGSNSIISLFDSAGLILDQDDDDDDFLDLTPTFDPVTVDALNSFLQMPLTVGTYKLVITQFDKFFNCIADDPLSNGFVRDGDPFFTSIFGCAAGQFCDLDPFVDSFDPLGVSFSESRTNRFAINISAEALAVPEPASLALLGFGLVGVGFIYRRRHHS